MDSYITNAKIELTEDCPHKCVFCYNPERRGVNLNYRAPFKDVTPQKVCMIVDKLIDYGIEIFTLTGGEVFTRRDLLYPALEQISSARLTATIVSNLALVNKEDAKKLKELKIGGVMTSFHSANKDKFNHIAGALTYDRVIQGIKYLQEENISVSANIVVINENKGEVYETGSYLINKLGIKSISISPIRPASEEQIKDMLSKEDYLKALDALLRLRKETGVCIRTQTTLPYCLLPDDPNYDVFKFECAVDNSEISVASTGDFKVCVVYHGIQGNILEEPIQEILARARKEDLIKNGIPKECKVVNCTQIDICRGGCLVEDYFFNKAELKNPYIDPSNPITRKPVRKVVPEEKLLHKTVKFDPDSSFVFLDEGLIKMVSYGKDAIINNSEYNVLGELIRQTYKYPNFKPWDLSMGLALKKNYFNSFLNRLKRLGVISFK